MDSTPQTNLFGQWQPTAIKGEQLPMFHEPVNVTRADDSTAADRKMAAKFDPRATPELWRARWPNGQPEIGQTVYVAEYGRGARRGIVVEIKRDEWNETKIVVQLECQDCTTCSLNVYPTAAEAEKASQP